MGLKKLDSEYKSHFKSLPVHRPVIVKAKVLSHPSDTAPEAMESSRRAGLLSNQFSNVVEPALQRKKIVPYKHNHNIFETRTVKELDDQQWLDAVGTDNDPTPRVPSTHRKTRNDDIKTQTKKKETEYTSRFANQRSEEDSPIITAANKTKRKKRLEDRKDKTYSVKKSQERSPERLPPAGRPTYISDPRDKRLLRPSDSSAYLTFPDQHPSKPETEYTERYESAAPKIQDKPITENKETSFIDEDTYRKVLLHRNGAYGLPISPVGLVETSPPRSQGRAVKHLGNKGKIDEHLMKTHSKNRNVERRRSDGSSSIHSGRERKKNDKRKKTQPKEHAVNDRDQTKMAEYLRRPRSLDDGSVSSVHSGRQPKESDKRKKTQPKAKEHAVNNRDQTKMIEHFRRARSLDGGSVSSVRSEKSDEPSRKKDNEQVKNNLAKARKTKTITKEGKRRNRRRDWENTPSSLDRRDDESIRSILGLKGTRQELVERGRSPTPEMRYVGQSRRHHLDVTTGSNNPLASSVDPYQTKVLSKMADLDIQRTPREEYDPSRYSDAGDSFSCSRSVASYNDRDSVDSRSLTATSRSSKRSN